MPTAVQESTAGVREPVGVQEPTRAQEPTGVQESTGRLIAEAHSGSRSAFTRLLSRYGQRLLAMTRKRIGEGVRDRVESQDILQDVMTEVVKRFPNCRFRREAEFVSWLKLILCNKIRDEARRSTAERTALRESWSRCDDDGGDSPSRELIRKEGILGLEAALERMPRRQAEVIRLRDIEGNSYDDVKRRLGLRTKDAARMLRRRAWVSLTAELERTLHVRS